MLQQMKRYLNSPLIQLSTGLILLISGLASAYYEFASADHTFRLGVHHGVIVWAVIQVLGSIPDLLDGLERSFEAFEKRQRA
jgi:hypothetical protein